ncbi:hypothetical protein GMOD_00007376 [Pyrenophora seminiperda CCB06]|uniref:Uncharacterized protein n=1 Tax=Pyrenophora seminiperda CCB06 TaxID=1302712 RepID=A0A3M7MDD5_9PLEO|nr:hypothetical protein GMOD_00007376 [Pyrenophora seminiperda CCB06]
MTTCDDMIDLATHEYNVSNLFLGGACTDIENAIIGTWATHDLVPNCDILFNNDHAIIARSARRALS